jgi:hypothetical protein
VTYPVANKEELLDGMVDVVWSEIEKATSGIDGEWKANEAPQHRERQAFARPPARRPIHASLRLPDTARR